MKLTSDVFEFDIDELAPIEDGAINFALEQADTLGVIRIGTELWIAGDDGPICLVSDLATSPELLFWQKESKDDLFDWIMELPYQPEIAHNMIGDPDHDPESETYNTKRRIDLKLKAHREVLAEIQDEAEDYIIEAHEEAIKKLEAERYQFNKEE